MPPSQLKRLKSSLREQGIVGPQKSKKQKKQASQGGHVQRNVALQGIREQFNPFEVKTPARASKHDFANAGINGDRAKKVVLGRPGVTKGMGEETRRKTLLVEMQRRKKVGRILDRRFGEDDPTMTPEDKAVERFVREKQRGSKKASIFDLDDPEESEKRFTHLGQPLNLEETGARDDFDVIRIDFSENDQVDAEGQRRSKKRRRLSGSDEEANVLSEDTNKEELDRPKTKQEVMKEVVAKSKFYKYERQKAKEDDDNLRAELDQGLSDVYALLRGSQPKPKSSQTELGTSGEALMNTDRAALLNGKDRIKADKEYDERLRQMAFDIRSKPTVRTKTEEEKLAREAERLKKLEEERLARMRGEDMNSDEEAAEGLDGEVDVEEMNYNPLGPGIPTQSEKPQFDVEDEDDFLIEDDLIASGSDIDPSEDGDAFISSSSSVVDEDEREFVQGLSSEQNLGIEGLERLQRVQSDHIQRSTGSSLAFTYPCPQSHQELLKITDKVSLQDLPTIIQRIRALYHPKLNSENKVKLGVFSQVLVDHLSYLPNQTQHPAFNVLETLIRHIHSLAKAFPSDVGNGFRAHLKSLQDKRSTNPTTGDLIILTAIATIFPTSDHFHQVVTPAMLSMARYLGQKAPKSLGELAKRAYIVTLCLQYQRFSKRYVPEAVNCVLNSVYALAPTKCKKVMGSFPYHESDLELRIVIESSAAAAIPRRLQFWDILHQDGLSSELDEELKTALLITNIGLVDTMAELWFGKSAYIEMFSPFSDILHFLLDKACCRNFSPITKGNIQTTYNKVQRLLQQSRLNRRPLLLHNHRPIAIKTFIPKFEESYNPDKHYDPDRDRAELGKLKAEHKRERKGALRELRKDSNFIARESLREKKERDSQYEAKYKRLVAEIQGEEGKEANAYEREKRMRKAKR